MSHHIQSLTILHTNDFHSHFESMARSATYIESIRNQKNGQVLLLDCGDHMDRSRIETEGTMGLANIAVINEMSYDAITIGNNEGITFTKEHLTNIYDDASTVPVVISNLVDLQTGELPSWFCQHLIVEKGEIRIGILGFTAPFTDIYRHMGWEIRDPFLIIQKEVDQLYEQVDFLIVLSHLGLKSDEWIATHISHIDLILGAHSHHLLEQGKQMGQTMLGAAGKFGSHIGHVEVVFDRYEKKCRIVEAKCIALNEFQENKKIQDMTSCFYTMGVKKLSERVATLNEELSLSLEAESPIGNLLAAMLRKWTNAEIGLVNAGQFIEGLKSGVITAQMLHHICPSPINPIKIKVTGDVLATTFEQALLPEYMYKPIYGFGFRGKVLGTLCLDNVMIHYNPEKEAFHKITSILIDGVPLEKSKQYSIGTIDMFQFGIGYESLKKGSVLETFMPEFIRDLVKIALNDDLLLTSCKHQHWEMIQ